VSAPSYLPRGELTTLLVTRLRTAGLLIGDGVAPPTGGWDDDPNLPTSKFLPYLVINPMAVPDPTGTVADSSADFRVPYSVTSLGISRKQCEVYSDRGRKELALLERNTVTLGGGDWKIQQARANSIGGVVRTDNTEPSEFTQSDVVTVWITKEI
jgi:hypothetical protein